EHLRARYPAVVALRANLVALPVADGSVDVVVSSQVLEHLWDQPRFVRECARVLRPGGRLLLSTPNRRTFPPGNVFHSRELDAGELAALLGETLRVERVLGVHHGPRLQAWEAAHGDLVRAQVAEPPDRWAAGLRDLVGAVSGADFTVTGDDVDASLDLVAVAVRP
ncbi:MAG TPA: methyltransferase domain-containing protein, partial [Candidatus Eisenbacteria bacterium]|nr:methyltransferase domain-containing protein [Candidatus Eisenbacteria bacterium]